MFAHASACTRVYSAWWFLLILAFLVVSTSLCIARNTPKILADLRNYKENVREQSLQSFHHKRAGRRSPRRPTRRCARIGDAARRRRLEGQGRRCATASGTMVAPRASGAANKLGYIAAHSAIVLVCIGGLLDGDLIVRAQMWLQGKTPYTGGGLIADVPAQHRLSATATPTFRGNLLVPEGARAGTAILTSPTAWCCRTCRSTSS